MIKTEIIDSYLDKIGVKDFSKDELLQFKKEINQSIDKEHREYFHNKIDSLLAGQD